MNTLLIVEDEKMIRQGIRTMVMRSGVPVNMILECNNGESAWEMLQSQEIDAMFTDIRMPKMDGIELVKRMQALPKMPVTVAISGYDDFSYAVEMMRGGVRDYLLKPVEREKLWDMLRMMEQEIALEKQQRSAAGGMSQQILRDLIADADADKVLAEVPEDVWASLFEKPYTVSCVRTGAERIVPAHGQALHRVDDLDVYMTEAGEAENLAEQLPAESIGISAVHTGPGELRAAYEEAAAMRISAFLQSCHTSVYSGPAKKVQESLRSEAVQHLGDKAQFARVQLLGTDKKEELHKAFHGLFYAAEHERITPAEFETSILNFLSETGKTYRNVLEDPSWDGQDRLNALRAIWANRNLTDYKELLRTYVEELSGRINTVNLLGGMDQKMAQAAAYIRENYAKDLNMAVVSNMFSMNYSQFSNAFKQYTGENFVAYLKNLRMEEARRLLGETDMHVHEVGRAVGYDNDKHFMKVFKASCGVSPSEYRRNAAMGNGKK